jgi:hypothetical protein
MRTTRAGFPLVFSQIYQKYEETEEVMNLPQRTCLVLAVVMLSILPTSAQEQPSALNEQMQTQSQNALPADPSASASTLNSKDSWQLDLTPYLWFAGTHGTAGAFGRDASVHSSAWDLLSHANFGLMGAADARYNRFVLSGDLMWIRLSDSSALPFPNLSAISADVRVGELVWTSKLGYRLIDSEKFKADATVGARYWHISQKLNFNPSFLGLNINPSQNWADIVVGGRVELPLGPKASVIAAGDVGGWNATAKLDYQFLGLLNLKVSPTWALNAGYRYLFVDWRSGSGIYNMVTPGAIIGLTYTFKPRVQ